MNTIAMQIDYECDRLAALNDYLAAQSEVRKWENVDVMKHVEALVKYELAKRKLRDFDDYEPEPQPEFSADRQTSDETFRRVNRRHGMHPDDPRRGQSRSINDKGYF